MATTDDVPRKPSAYRPTQHFAERFKDNYEPDAPPRHLDGDIVEGCIRNGNVAPSGASTVRFYEWFDGVEFALVVNVSSKCVVSGYPVSVDEAAAGEAGRWSRDQLDDIRARIRLHDTDDR